MGALLQLLEQQEQFMDGMHFVYTSDNHGTGYVNNRFLGKEAWKAELEQFSLELLEKTLSQAEINLDKPILVIGVRTLGAKMAKVAVAAYNRKHDARLRHAVIWYDKHDDGTKTYYWHSENPGINHLCTPETQVIWMDDLLNASSTLTNTRDIFEDRSPIAAVATLFDRSSWTASELNVPHLVSLEKHHMPIYAPDDCPLIRDKVPIVENFGNGAKFKRNHPDYPGGYVTI